MQLDMNPQHTYHFADRNGEKYRVSYKRDAWGRHSWDVVHESGEGVTHTTFRHQERDLTADEIEREARSLAACFAADRGLFEPDGKIDERGFPSGAVYLVRAR